MKSYRKNCEDKFKLYNIPKYIKYEKDIVFNESNMYSYIFFWEKMFLICHVYDTKNEFVIRDIWHKNLNINLIYENRFRTIDSAIIVLFKRFILRNFHKLFIFSFIELPTDITLQIQLLYFKL